MVGVGGGGKRRKEGKVQVSFFAWREGESDAEEVREGAV